MMLNPNLFSCQNFHYNFVESIVIGSEGKFTLGVNTHCGQEAYDRYSQESIELFNSFNNDFWIKLSDNEVSYKSKIEFHFLTMDYSMLDLLIIAENLARIKLHKWEKHESIMFDQCVNCLISRLNSLQPMICAVECLKFMKEELKLLPSGLWETLHGEKQC